MRRALTDVDPATVEALITWYGITDEGHFDGRSIPNRLHARGQLAMPAELDDARRRLLAARALRPRPGLDDKVLTEWNALFLSSLTEAGGDVRRDATGSTSPSPTASSCCRELRGDNGRWFRSWHADGTPPARHDALAADHAALVDAFTRLAEATGQARWIAEASATADTMLDWFWDVDHGGLFTTADDEETLIVRQKDLLDDATPSANSTAANALYRLAALTGEQRYAHQADRILQLVGAVIEEAPAALRQRPRRRRVPAARGDRGRRHRRSPRPGSPGADDLAARSRAGLG